MAVLLYLGIYPSSFSPFLLPFFLIFFYSYALHIHHHLFIEKKKKDIYIFFCYFVESTTFIALITSLESLTMATACAFNIIDDPHGYARMYGYIETASNYVPEYYKSISFELICFSTSLLIYRKASLKHKLINTGINSTLLILPIFSRIGIGLKENFPS